MERRPVGDAERVTKGPHNVIKKYQALSDALSPIAAFRYYYNKAKLNDSNDFENQVENRADAAEKNGTEHFAPLRSF